MRQFLGFGDGSDGILDISVDTTEAPIDASCSGTSGSRSLSATNTSFAAGQKIFIWEVRGTGVGAWELNTIESYVAGTITCVHPLDNTYTDSGASQAQVRVVPQYSSVNVQAGKTYSAKAWDGNVGGALVFMCSGNMTIPGTLSVGGKGYKGGQATSTNGWSGEGSTGASVQQTAANDTGGGGGAMGFDPGDFEGAGGGGGSHSSVGTVGKSISAVVGAAATTLVGQADLTTLFPGGGGGSNGANRSGSNGVAGGGGGGALIAFVGGTVTVTGSITANGANGTQNITDFYSGSGGGAGGSILIKTGSTVLGSSLVTATGGTGGTSNNKGTGGTGGTGRIRIEACSVSGTTNPAASSVEGGHDWCSFGGQVF
jgi:hypothetical protein